MVQGRLLRRQRGLQCSEAFVGASNFLMYVWNVRLHALRIHPRLFTGSPQTNRSKKRDRA